MNTTITALVDPRPDGGWEVRSPGVGIYRDHPQPGGSRITGDPVGTLTVLNRRLEMILPPGTGGVVIDLAIHDRAVPVEYGQTLFRLAPATGDVVPPVAGGKGATAAGLPDGTLPVICPIDGVFYRRSAPGAAPFVAVGDTVETGRTLGLIEAMKSFNAVAYGGPGLPERAVIVEVRAEDVADVRQGAVLVVVRPA